MLHVLVHTQHAKPRRTTARWRAVSAAALDAACTRAQPHAGRTPPARHAPFTCDDSAAHISYTHLTLPCVRRQRVRTRSSVRRGGRCYPPQRTSAARRCASRSDGPRSAARGCAATRTAVSHACGSERCSRRKRAATGYCDGTRERSGVPGHPHLVTYVYCDVFFSMTKHFI